MADDTMLFNVAAKDNASATVKGIRGLIQSVGAEAKRSILTGVGIGGGIAAFNAMAGAVRAVTGYLGDAIGAAQADEASIVLLTTALKENAKGWDGSTKAIEATIAERMKLGFTDEEQRASLGVLVAMVKDHTAALEINRVAMDLARLKGISLETASTVLGKAYNGNVVALQRMGIQIEKGTKGMDALGAVQERVAGQAEAFGETSAGAAARAAIQFEELQEEIGRQLLPAVTALATFAVEVLIPAMREVVAVIASIVDAIGDITVAVGEAVTTTALQFGDMGDRMHQVADDLDVDFADVVLRTRDYMTNMGLSFEDAADKAESDFQRLADGVSPAMIALENLPAGTKQAMVGMTNEVTAGTDAIVGDVAEMPGEMANALLAGQFELTDAVSELVRFMDEAISPAQEQLNARAFLASQAYKDGLASGIPSVIKKMQEMRDRALAVLATPLPTSFGASIGSSWINSMINAVRFGRQTLQQEMNEIRDLMGRSLPTKGPLAGGAPRRGGLSIGQSWARGIGEGIRGEVGNLTSAMPSMGMGGAIRGPAAVGAGGGGNGLTVIFQTAFPPSPSQANGIAQSIGPELERWRRQQGLA